MPSTIKTRPLHRGTCMDDLVEEVDKMKLEKRSPKMVLNRLAKLYDEGNKYRLNGDEEMTYIYFMRWIKCIKWLQKTPDYIKNKNFLKPHVSGSKVHEMLDLLEDLRSRLSERYEEKKLEDSVRRISGKGERMQIEPEQANDDDLLDEMGDIQLSLPDTPTDEPANREPEIAITCMKMFQEMQALGERIIIVDIREQTDFNNSHIKSDQCLNIPPELIKNGILATDIFKSLRAVGKPVQLIRHRAREYCDLIVLLDWQTTKGSLKPTSRLQVLKNILLDWDPGVAYGQILVLDGGYKEWLNHFPTLTTNPSVGAPDVEGNTLAEMLEDVDYPELAPSDEDEPMNNSRPKPIPARSLKPKINEKRDLTINKFDVSDNRKSQGTKLTYNTNKADNHSDNLNTTNILDNAFIDGTRSVSNKVAENLTDNDSKFTRNGRAHVTSMKTLENDFVKPVIDRSSKPVVKTYHAESEKLLSLLRQQKEILKSQLKLENETLVLESQLFGREDDEDDNFEQRTEMLKRIDELSADMVEKVKQISEIKRMLLKYKQSGFEVASSYLDERNQLQLDIGLAEHEARTVAIQRRLQRSKRDKKLEENLEMKQRNMATPPHISGNDTVKTPLKNDGPSTNSGLKRSHSSPNLAQLDTRKESPSRALDNSTPQVDRTSKPLQQQHQDRNNMVNNTFSYKQPLRRDREQRMNPIFGDVHPGITGLKNLGNSCYMNSIIQCLSNTTSLARYFIQGSYTDDLNTKNRKTEGLVVEEVAQVIKALWCGHYRSISPRDLKVVIGQYRPQFRNSEQQDSHEFLTFLFDWMHDDLKTSTQKAKLELDRSISNAEKEWDKAMSGKTSIISQLFYGQLRSTIICATCGNNSTTYENFNSLTLSLPDSIRCTLDDCIRKYVSGQRVSEWRCPTCKAARDATKKFDFVKLAPIIVIHLNRFGESDGWIQKTNTAVDFPLTSLDLRSYVAADSGTTTTTNSYHQTYNLYAVSNHYGTMEGGHYTAYCNSASQNKWYKYDDHTVREVSPSEVKLQTTSAYLLFYTSVPISPYMVM